MFRASRGIGWLPVFVAIGGLVSSTVVLLAAPLASVPQSSADAWPATAPLASTSPAPATRPSANRVPILRLHGTGTELGTQQGTALRDSIRQLYHQYFTKFIRTDGERFAALAGAAIFETELTPIYRDEVHALAVATGLDERQVMLAQCFLDLTAMTGCSTVAVPAGGSPDGVPRMGRNLDFFSFDVADKATILLAYHPTGKYAFVSVAWPGMIGVLSGMNEKGLCLANMEVKRNPRWPSALPYTLLYRSILEQCATVDQAIALLEKSQRQTANNLMLIDAQGNRAVAEITPESVHVRQAPPTAALVCTNHQRGDDLDTPGRCWRYDLLHDEAKTQFGTIAVQQIKQMLATTAQGDMTMQSMIFEPSDRVLYLATGKEATRNPYLRYDLAEALGSR
jgi:isopenicillin-N N-acyltransferase-like protein